MYTYSLSRTSHFNDIVSRQNGYILNIVEAGPKMKIFQIVHKILHHRLLKLSVTPQLGFLVQYKVMSLVSGQGGRYFVISPSC